MEEINKLIGFGIINIDKPSGPTSFSVTDFVRRSLDLSKASHMGTLDPKVTGVLPITLGRACKLSAYFMHHNKSYVGVLHTHREQDIEDLQKVINKNFVGRIKQIPPHKSAVKRAERQREVFSFRLLEGKNKRDFLFFCEVEGGTYIRKICSDLGEMIGGAHMAELRRTGAGIFGEEKIYTLYEFEEAIKEWKEGKEEKIREMIVSADEAIKKVLPFVEVKKEVLGRLYTGKPLIREDLKGEIKGEVFAVFCGGDFVGVYRKVNEKGIVGRAEFVKN
ncbi:MAG: RNA-guided pseudouridylation complex pseudouridine synthase subunit Cbf5 [Candidatus Pacearchaeota archaeon]